MTRLVIGAGVSGLGAAKFLRAKGEAVRVSERSTLAADQATAFRALGVDLRDGGHDLTHLDGVTGVILSPGLPATHPLVVEAARRGLPAVSEIDLALASYKGRVLAVTGTGEDLAAAALRAYTGMSAIRFDGMQYRRDIGARALQRQEEAIS